MLKDFPFTFVANANANVALSRLLVDKCQVSATVLAKNNVEEHFGVLMQVNTFFQL